MRRLGSLWLFLAVAGAIMPLLHFKTWFEEREFSLNALMEGWLANPAAAGMMWSLLFAALVVTVAEIAHATARRDWTSLICLPVTWFVGVGAGLPLFIWFITRSPRSVR